MVETMKDLPENHVTVTQAAEFCGVGRNTVGYWIRSGKIKAIRIEKRYAIHVEELTRFLKSSGQPVPRAFFDRLGAHPNLQSYLRPFCLCSEFMKEIEHDKDCEHCAAGRQCLIPCFAARSTGMVETSGPCSECRYYEAVYQPRVRMVLQFAQPAAILKGVHIWAGNQAFADRCGLSVEELIGTGIESVVHPDAQASAMGEFKKIAAGGLDGPKKIEIRLKHDGPDGLGLFVYPMTEPEGAFLLVA
jgi:excisionase family DNA binding protein